MKLIKIGNMLVNILSMNITSKVYSFFDKKTGSAVSVNEQLAEDLHKPVTKKFKRKV